MGPMYLQACHAEPPQSLRLIPSPHRPQKDWRHGGLGWLSLPRQLEHRTDQIHCARPDRLPLAEESPFWRSLHQAVVGAAEGAEGFDAAHEACVRTLGPPPPGQTERTDAAHYG